MIAGGDDRRSERGRISAKIHYIWTLAEGRYPEQLAQRSSAEPLCARSRAAFWTARHDLSGRAGKSQGFRAPKPASGIRLSQRAGDDLAFNRSYIKSALARALKSNDRSVCGRAPAVERQRFDRAGAKVSPFRVMI